MSLATLRALGFDTSKHVPFSSTYTVRCSSCEAVVVNGHPIHERGCPNDRHECNGCNALIPATRKYCSDCA